MSNTEFENENLNQEKKYRTFFKFYDYIIMIALILIAVGFSFLVGIYAFSEIKKTTWVMMAIGGGYLLIVLILSEIKGRHAINFYENKRMRYRKTGTIFEHQIRRWFYIFLISGVGTLLLSVILLFCL
jgi:hypothetical protein